MKATRRSLIRTLGASTVGAAAVAATASNASASFGNGTGVRTIASSLNVRSGPGTNYGILDSVSRGTLATVTSGPSGSRWYQLDFANSNLTGWCEASYLIPAYAWPHSGINEAVQYTGVPYQWGGKYPSEGFDCSGLIWYAYTQAGIVGNDFPQGSWGQSRYGTAVSSLADARSGDLLYWAGDPAHIVIHLGHQKVFHAPSTGRVCQVDHRSTVRGGRAPDRIRRVT